MQGYDTKMNQGVYQPPSSCKDEYQPVKSCGNDLGQDEGDGADKDDDYYVKGELGRGNFSRVKLAIHILSGGGDEVISLNFRCLAFFFRDGCCKGD